MDDALRRLERAARDHGTPEEGIRLARQLERLGRLDDAVVALRPAWRDPETRPILANVPAWSDPAGTAGAARALEVGPMLEPPRIRWVARLPGGTARRLAASPLGVAVTLRSDTNVGHVVVLDPEDGKVSWRAPGTDATIVRDVLFLRAGKELIAHDLVSGERLYAETFPGAVRPVPRGCTFDLYSFVRGHATRSVGWMPHPDPRVRPGEVAFRVEQNDEEWSELEPLVTPQSFIVRSRDLGASVVSLATRETRTVTPALHLLAADERGFAAKVRGSPDAALLDATGQVLWRSNAHPLALGREVAAFARPDGVVQTIGREPVVALASIRLSRQPIVAMARDVAYLLAGFELVGLHHRSGKIWDLDLRDAVRGQPITSLAPGLRRLHVLAPPDLVVCVETP